MSLEPWLYFKVGITTGEIDCGPSFANSFLAMNEGEGTSWTYSQSPKHKSPSRVHA